MLGGALQQITYPRFTVGSPDTYLYYRLLINGFKINAFLLSMYLIIHILWKNSIIDIPDFFIFRSLGESFSITYPLIAAPILIIFGIIYGYLHARANINFNQLDLLWWVKSKLTEGAGADRKTILKAMKWGVFILTLSIFISPSLPLWFLYQAHFNAESYLFIILVSILYLWSFSTFIAYSAYGCLVYYQHKYKLGPRYLGEKK